MEDAIPIVGNIRNLIVWKVENPQVPYFFKVVVAIGEHGFFVLVREQHHLARQDKLIHGTSPSFLKKIRVNVLYCYCLSLTIISAVQLTKFKR